jgi:hypothetical protein
MDFTYCKGKGCGLRNSCTRYLKGFQNLGSANQHWMDNCDAESRECYIDER